MDVALANKLHEAMSAWLHTADAQESKDFVAARVWLDAQTRRK